MFCESSRVQMCLERVCARLGGAECISMQQENILCVLPALVVTTRCQYCGGGRALSEQVWTGLRWWPVMSVAGSWEGVGLQLNKFEQAPRFDVWGTYGITEGVPLACDLSYDACDVDLPPSPPPTHREQTDTCEKHHLHAT